VADEVVGDAAQGTPAWRKTSFIATLSRQGKAVRAEMPGMVQASRTLAAGRTCASTVASEPVDPLARLGGNPPVSAAFR
jgi:hypothetical protein